MYTYSGVCSCQGSGCQFLASSQPRFYVSLQVWFAWGFPVVWLLSDRRRTESLKLKHTETHAYTTTAWSSDKCRVFCDYHCASTLESPSDNYFFLLTACPLSWKRFSPFSWILLTSLIGFVHQRSFYIIPLENGTKLAPTRCICTNLQYLGKTYYATHLRTRTNCVVKFHIRLNSVLLPHLRCSLFTDTLSISYRPPIWTNHYVFWLDMIVNIFPLSLQLPPACLPCFDRFAFVHCVWNLV